MAMSRKDFQALADGLKSTQPRQMSNMMIQWQNDVRIVADACKATNPAFKRETFYAACGMEG